jgi:3-hydroxyacyl-CoA dehydrogenase
MANIPPLSFLRIIEDLDRGGGHQEWFYEMQGDLDGVIASMEILKERGEWDRHKKMDLIHRTLLNHQYRMRAHGNWMNDWRAQRDMLMSQKDLTFDQEKQRDRIYRRMRKERKERTKQLREEITVESPSIVEQIRSMV